MSRKFWSAENFGPGTKILGKIVPGGQCFSEKIGPDSKILVRRSCIVVARRARCIYIAPLGRQCSVGGPLHIVAFLYVQLVRYHPLSQRSGFCGWEEIPMLRSSPRVVRIWKLFIENPLDIQYALLYTHYMHTMFALGYMYCKYEWLLEVATDG